MPANATRSRNRRLQATPIGHCSGWKGCAARLASATPQAIRCDTIQGKGHGLPVMVVYLRVLGRLSAAAKGTNRQMRLDAAFSRPPLQEQIHLIGVGYLSKWANSGLTL